MQKALNAHPAIKMMYQPFPDFFIETKKHFFSERNIPPRYHALGHYCLESDYTHKEFMEWLDNHLLPQTVVQRAVKGEGVLEASAGTQKKEYSFSQGYAYLLQGLCSHGGQRYLGSKEVLVEEYVPYLVHNNVRCVIIVRDPRDVITSLDYGRGKVFVGDHRPTLFNLRNWRKSVNFAQTLKDNPHFLLIKFEDLVFDPVSVLNRIAHFLDVEPFHEKLWVNGLKDENGVHWRGNSSFGDMKPFDKNTIGEHKKNLPEKTRLYVEAICRHEMLYMGYAIEDVTIGECERNIISFNDNFTIERDEFEKDYSVNSDNVKYEIARLNDKLNFVF